MCKRKQFLLFAIEMVVLSVFSQKKALVLQELRNFTLIAIVFVVFTNSFSVIVIKVKEITIYYKVGGEFLV